MLLLPAAPAARRARPGPPDPSPLRRRVRARWGNDAVAARRAAAWSGPRANRRRPSRGRRDRPVGRGARRRCVSRPPVRVARVRTTARPVGRCRLRRVRPRGCPTPPSADRHRWPRRSPRSGRPALRTGQLATPRRPQPGCPGGEPRPPGQHGDDRRSSPLPTPRGAMSGIRTLRRARTRRRRWARDRPALPPSGLHPR